jgi:hypothetical protein
MQHKAFLTRNFQETWLGPAYYVYIQYVLKFLNIVLEHLSSLDWKNVLKNISLDLDVNILLREKISA